MTWKDNWRDEYEQTNLSWEDFHEQKFVYIDNIPETEMENLRKEVEAMKNEYRQMKRELHEVRVLMESEDFEP